MHRDLPPSRFHETSGSASDSERGEQQTANPHRIALYAIAGVSAYLCPRSAALPADGSLPVSGRVAFVPPKITPAGRPQYSEGSRESRNLQPAASNPRNRQPLRQTPRTESVEPLDPPYESYRGAVPPSITPGFPFWALARPQYTPALPRIRRLLAAEPCTSLLTLGKIYAKELPRHSRHNRQSALFLLANAPPFSRAVGLSTLLGVFPCSCSLATSLRLRKLRPAANAQ